MQYVIHFVLLLTICYKCHKCVTKCPFNQLVTYYLPVCYLLRIQQYLVNTLTIALAATIAYYSLFNIAPMNWDQTNTIPLAFLKFFKEIFVLTWIQYVSVVLKIEEIIFIQQAYIFSNMTIFRETCNFVSPNHFMVFALTFAISMQDWLIDWLNHYSWYS